MNSHLGRFLTHADELIQECRSFGESMRASLDEQLGKMTDTVSRTLDSAAQRAAEQAAARLDGRLDEALGGSLVALRQKLEELSRMTTDLAGPVAAERARASVALPSPDAPVTGTAVPPPVRLRPALPRGFAALLASANLMLAALVVLAVLDLGAGQPSGNQGAAAALAGVDAGAAPGAPLVPAPGTTGAPGEAPGEDPPEHPMEALCAALAEGADPAQAQAFVAAAAASACGDQAGEVTANTLEGLSARADDDDGAGGERPTGKKAPQRRAKPRK